VGPKALDLVVEGVVYRDFVVAMIVDRIRQQLEAKAMSSPIVSPRMLPGRCDEEVCVYRFVQ
jgi:hypothetical protein